MAQLVTKLTLCFYENPAALQEIKFWESKSKKDKSIQNRVERLYTARKHLIENPKASEELIQRLP